MKRLILLCFCSLALLAVTAGSFTPSGAAQDATPAPGEFEIAPGVVAYDAVFAEGQEEPLSYRLRFDPGVTYAFEGAPSLDLVYVELGTATLRLDAPTTVHRPAAAGENVAPDAEFTVSAGDYFVLAPLTVGEVRNDGQEPVIVSVAGILPGGTGTATPNA